MIRRLLVLSVLVACLVLIASCGGGGTEVRQPSTNPTLAALTLSPDSLSVATVGVPYNFSGFTVQGGTGPFTFSVAGTLPPGLTFTSSSNPNTGVLSGTPTTAGTFRFTVTVTGAQNRTGSRSYDLVVDTEFRITTATLPTAEVGVSYSQPINAVNGVTPLSWAVVAGANLGPLGLALDPATGRVTGTPTTTASIWFEAQATDSSSPPRTSRQTITLQIVNQLTFLTQSPLILRRNQATSVNIVTSGGVTPIVVEMVAGALPPGLQFNAGMISGVPTQLGTFSVTMQARDSYIGGSQTVNKTFTINVRERAPVVLTKELPLAIVGRAYDYTLSADGGARPFTWDPIPAIPGLSFNTAQGRITGTPTTAGNYFVPVRLFDSSVPAEQATRSFNFKVAAAPRGRNDSIATATPVGNEGVAATLSPFVNATGIEAPDNDYYVATANGGAQVFVEVQRNHAFGFESQVDPVLEIVNASGQRLTTCQNEGTDDGVTGTPDPTPTAFDDPCLNDDVELGVNLNSLLRLQIPPGPPVTFYIHVLDWRGDARPDLAYLLVVSGVN